MTGSLLYAVLYALALVPGLPIGLRLFGRRHAAGWIAGSALGYFLTSLALWAVIAAGMPSALAFVVAWLVTTALVTVAARPWKDPLVALPAWTGRDSTALALVLMLTLTITVIPFARLGATDGQGNRYYRAYFTADFVWHMAVTSELKKFAMPPRNMFMPNRPLHYYWAYYLVPAAISGTGPAALRDVERSLTMNAIGTALLLAASIFFAAWAALPRAAAIGWSVALAVTASSAEGAVALLRIVRRGAPLAAVRDLNIDAIANWWYHGLRVDGLQRCFWWVPQHSMSYVLGLVGIAIAAAAGSGASAGVYLVAGIALGGAVAFNPFVGAIFAAAWGLALAIDAFRARDRVVARLLRCAVASVPVLLALAWDTANQMAGNAPAIVEFGLRGDAAQSPIRNLLLSLGPALIPAVLGLAATWRARPDHERTRAALEARPAALEARRAALEARRAALEARRAAPEARRAALERPLHVRAMPAAVLAGIALLVMHLVRLQVDPSWVGFRGGQIFLVAIPALVACGLVAEGWRRAGIATVAAAFLLGMPTTAIDLYNAQDITNLSPGPGFPWTETLDKPHVDALEWVRRATPSDAVVQLDPTARGETTWTIVSSFGERRMAASLPRTLVKEPEYAERSARVRDMFATPSAEQAHAIAAAMRIDYIWVDAVERAAYPEGVRKFDASPQYFAPAFRNTEVSIYQVLP